jgi:hypothetical protein
MQVAAGGVVQQYRLTSAPRVGEVINMVMKFVAIQIQFRHVLTPFRDLPPDVPHGASSGTFF